MLPPPRAPITRVALPQNQLCVQDNSSSTARFSEINQRLVINLHAWILFAQAGLSQAFQAAHYFIAPFLRRELFRR